MEPWTVLRNDCILIHLRDCKKYLRSDSRDSKNRVRSSDAHSTSGTLGRRNKGGMWEDPQQRMIQEQLDSMRDDEIIELKNKPNKTPKDEERYDSYRISSVTTGK